MNIHHIRTVQGPNIYRHDPLLVVTLAFDPDVDRSAAIPACLDRLIPLLAQPAHSVVVSADGWADHLRTCQDWPHLIAQVVQHLSRLVGIPAAWTKVVPADQPHRARLIVAHQADGGTRALCSTALELLKAVQAGDGFPLGQQLAAVREVIAETELGPSTRAIVEAAQQRGIPVARLNDAGLVQLGYGKQRRYIQAAMSDGTSAVGMEIASDKALTKALLDRAAIPVPNGRVVQTADEAVAALGALGAPVVVKPLDGRQGRGVSLDLHTAEEVRTAFGLAQEFGSAVMVEELFCGRNYRLLVVGGKLVAASERLPAQVVGDGRHSLQQLIEITNADPRRGNGHEKPLTRIVPDPIMLAHLEQIGLTLDSVPGAGHVVVLRPNANLSTGGTAIDVTDVVHPELRRMCERAARTIGLDICGIDLVVPEITTAYNGQGGIIEVNAAPGLRMHQFPSTGRGRDVGKAIVDNLFPPPATGRIPIVSITGTNGKTTTTRMIGHVLAATGKAVGMTTTDGIWIDGACVTRGDTTGPISARTVLADPGVEIAVLETARGGIVRSGLGYDWSDVAVLTNIQPDHIGQDGITSVADLVHIKALVAERVRPGGTLVLNADDPQLLQIAADPQICCVEKELIYFSLNPRNSVIQHHCATGGRAFVFKDGWLVELQGRHEQRLLAAATIPVTLDGTAHFHIANALAAMAACRAVGVAQADLGALGEFGGVQTNPGRTNLYRVGEGYVLIDYGHNPDAFTAICAMTTRWQGRRITGIVGVPGDRADSVITQAAQVAACGFESIIIREDHDLRGRKPGEVADMVFEAMQAYLPEGSCTIIHDEAAALSMALDTMIPDEVIVMFYDSWEVVQAVLNKYEAIPATRLEPVMSLLSLERG